MDVREEFIANRDEKYAIFTSRLVETGSPILGVRLPVLRDIAKRIAKDDWESYLNSWHCECMEDVMLKGSGFLDIWLYMLILFIMAAVLMTVSLIRLDKRR